MLRRWRRPPTNTSQRRFHTLTLRTRPAAPRRRPRTRPWPAPRRAPARRPRRLARPRRRGRSARRRRATRRAPGSVLAGPISNAPPAGYVLSLSSETGRPSALRKDTCVTGAFISAAQAATRAWSVVVVCRSSVIMPAGPRRRSRTGWGATGAGAVRELPDGSASVLVGVVLARTMILVCRTGALESQPVNRCDYARLEASTLGVDVREQ